MNSEAISSPVFSTALILCGGFGTRLQPLTQTTPKPLIELANIPLIEHILEQVISQGVTTIVLAVGNYSQYYAPYVPFWRRVFTKDIYIVADGDESGKPLGTGGAVLYVAELLPHFFSEPFYVLNGDILMTQPLERLATSIKYHSALVAMASIHVPDLSAFGALLLTPDGHVSGFLEKSKKGPGEANAGLYAIDPDALKYFKKPSSIEHDVFPYIASDGKLVAVPLEKNSPWFDLGTIKSYSMVTEWVLGMRDEVKPMEERKDRKCISTRVERSMKETKELELDGVIKPPSIISKAATIGPGCVIGPNAVIGAGCIIGDGCLIKDSVLLPRVILGSHCVINHCVLSSDSEIPNDTTIEDEVR